MRVASRVLDRLGVALLVLLSPVVIAWTLFSFWHLARTGRLYVREHGHFVEASGGLEFWLTLALYGVLLPGALVVLGSFLSRLRRRSPNKPQ